MTNPSPRPARIFYPVPHTAKAIAAYLAEHATAEVIDFDLTDHANVADLRVRGEGGECVLRRMSLANARKLAAK